MFKFLLPLFLIGSLAHADTSVPRSMQYAWSQYDVAASSGASVPHSLGVKLPANSIITHVWVYINAPFTSSGSSSVALSCAGTRDIMDYQDLTAWSQGNIVGRSLTPTAPGTTAYIPLLASSSQVALNAGVGSVPTACQLIANVRGDAGFKPLTAGKATIIVEYFNAGVLP